MAENVYCNNGANVYFLGAKIIHVRHRVHEEVQPRFYSSKSSILDMTAGDFVHRIGDMDAKSVRKLSDRWPMYRSDLKRNFNTFKELNLPADDDFLEILAMAIHLKDPWWTFKPLKSHGFAAALNLSSDTGGDPRYPAL
jgi:hypothetical protein